MGSKLSCCFRVKKNPPAAEQELEALRDIQREVPRRQPPPPLVVVCPPPSPRLLNVHGEEELDFRNSSTLCLWSWDPRESGHKESGIPVEVSVGNEMYFSCAQNETDVDGEWSSSKSDRIPTPPNSNGSSENEVSRRTSYTSAASPVCRLQFFQSEDDHHVDPAEWNPSCGGIFIYDDQVGKSRFFGQLR